MVSSKIMFAKNCLKKGVMLIGCKMNFCNSSYAVADKENAEVFIEVHMKEIRGSGWCFYIKFHTCLNCCRKILIAK